METSTTAKEGGTQIKSWIVTINFCGFIGCDEKYIVDADTEEEAIEEALEMARDDIAVTDVEEDEEEDWDD